MTHPVSTFAQKPGLRPGIDRLSAAAWPRFLVHGDLRHWELLFELFPEFQLLLCDAGGNLIAIGHTVPLIWDGTVPDLPPTMDRILVRAEKVRRDAGAPNTLCAMAAIVGSGHRGQNLSTTVIREMKRLARQHGYTTLIAPVRPTLKSQYPLTPMDRYVEWARTDGSPFDPWIRVHWRLGAQPLCIGHKRLTVQGTVTEWENWTGMAFPESGSYIIPGALQPLQVDREKDTGRYEDPCYWMKHPAADNSGGHPKPA